MSTNPRAGTRVGAISHIRPTDRGDRQVGHACGPCAAGQPATTVTDLLHAQVDRTPDAIAVDDGTMQLTYAEVHARANQLARHLRSLGVGPETLVGICIPRSCDMVVAVLGVLHAGGAYVPLDPAYPAERLAFMLADANPRAVIGPHDLLDGLPLNGISPVRLDADASRIESQDPSRLDVAVTPANLAYVLYTSGSTGRPKGVMVAHASVVQLIQWAQSSYSREELAVVAAATSLNFDLSVYELFVTLSAGGTVWVLPHALALADLDQTTGVTLVNTVPSIMHELLRVGRVPASVLTVNLAGEPLAADLAQRVYDTTSASRVTNLYGPTETTVYVAGHEVGRGESGLLPIGRPLPNAVIYLLDEDQQPVPAGEVGEIWIGGDWLARGYLGRPELTRERFVACPFADDPGARMYRSGDLGRLRPDGTIVCLGRIDHQVKVRGYRIELGEVEATLCRHPGVRQALVRATPADHGPVRLVAYTVPVGEPVPAGDLRRLTRSSLPEYMVPSAFLSLDAFPLAPNGKIDNLALPRPPSWPAAADDIGRLPETADDVERAVARVCADVLRLDRPVGIGEDFLDDLGGTSLLAVHLLVELEKTFGIRLPVTTLLRDTTVKGFAEAVRNVDGHASNLILNPDGEFEPLFLVHGWVGGVLQYRALAPHLDPRQPVIGLHPQELDLGRSLDTSIEGMAARAITLMRGLKPAGPYLIGGHSIGGMIAYEMARQLSEQGQESAIVLLIDTHVPRHGLRLVRQKVRWYREAFRDRPIRDRLTHGRKVIDYRVGRPLRRWVKGLPAESDDRTSFDSLARNDEANYTALGHFVAKPYDGRVVVARTADWTLKAGAEDLGWTSLVKGYLEIRLLPGSHFTLFDEPNVAVVGDFISSTLAELRNGSVPQTPAAGAQAGSPGDHR